MTNSPQSTPTSAAHNHPQGWIGHCPICCPHCLETTTMPTNPPQSNQENNISLNLSNNQAAHLWGIMAAYIYDTGNELKKRGIYKQDGTLKKSRKYFSDFEQGMLDNIALAELILKELEPHVDFPGEEDSEG